MDRRKTVHINCTYVAIDMTSYDFELEEEVTGLPTGIKGNLFKPINLWYLLMLVIIIFGKGRLGIEQIDKAFLYGSLGIVIPFTLSLLWVWFYHKTAKVVWPGGHSTTTGRFETVGAFRMVRLDGLRSGQFEWQPNKGVLIAPAVAVHKIGNSFMILARCVPQKYEKLPRVIRNHIKMTGYKPPFVMGYISEEQYTEILPEGESPTHKKVPIGQITSMIEDLNQENTFLSTLLGRELGAFEDIADLTNRVYDRLRSKPGIVQKIKERVVKEED